jgi:hypothetical protein
VLYNLFIKSTPNCSCSTPLASVITALLIEITCSTIFSEFNFAKCAINYPVILPEPVNVTIVSVPSVVTVGEPVVVPE